ncbi:MAG: AAA family ATPase, partial [Pseudomonadota bacterium]
RDLFPVPAPSGIEFEPFEATLWHLLSRKRIGALLVHDPIEGLRLHAGCDARYASVLEECGITLGQKCENGDDLAALIRTVMQESRLSIGLMVDYASITSSIDAAAAERLFVLVDKLSREPAPARPAKGHDWPPRNPIFWMVERPGDIPEWVGARNPGYRDLILGTPDLADRASFITMLAEDLPSDDLDIDQKAQRIEKAAVRCEGMTLREMEAVIGLARAAGRGIDGFEDALRSFLIGTSRDPWVSSAMRRRVRNARAVMESRVKGQRRAVDKTCDILIRSIMGLSGAHTTRPGGRPRGVLFFVGPTGTGKTELAKAITEVLFGDETAMRRFDMSEFMTEESIGRLIGPPPGAAGHEDGGELVNAVRERPFNVFLFDEVEKGHPRILDTFLQILDDGRLSDTRGETGYFSEALLIFTSNIGMQGTDKSSNAGQVVLPSDSPEMVEIKLTDAVRTHFRTELRRPELFNRFGQNIVPFEFINSRSATAIFDGVLTRALMAVKEMHGVEVMMDDWALNQLLELCATDLNEGGRGIGNRIETFLINPLARLLFEREELTQITITAFELVDRDWVLHISEDERRETAA